MNTSLKKKKHWFPVVLRALHLSKPLYSAATQVILFYNINFN